MVGLLAYFWELEKYAIVCAVIFLLFDSLLFCFFDSLGGPPPASK